MKTPKASKPKTKKPAAKAEQAEGVGSIPSGKGTDSIYSITTEQPTLVLESGRLSLAISEPDQDSVLAVNLYGRPHSGKTFIGSLQTLFETDFTIHPSTIHQPISAEFLKIPAPPVPKTLPADALLFSVSVYDRSGYYHAIDTERAVPVSPEPDQGPKGPPVNQIVELLGKPPAMDLARAVSDLAELDRAVCVVKAARLQPALNAHVQAMPQGTYPEKQEIAWRVNEEVQRFGLAIRVTVDEEIDSKTEKRTYPAILVAHADRTTPNGVFRFQYRGADGNRHRAGFEKTVPPLELMEAPVRAEGRRHSGRFDAEPRGQGRG